MLKIRTSKITAALLESRIIMEQTLTQKKVQIDL